MIGFRGLPSMAERWRQLGARERAMLALLGAFLLVATLIKGVWQPTQQRLERAERTYHQHLALAFDMQKARPIRQSQSSQPWSSHLSESVAAAGLELLQLDKDPRSLRAAISGDGRVLLDWLIKTERDGARMQSMVLERQDDQLRASVVWMLD
jgi:general secretion pathway protein M